MEGLASLVLAKLVGEATSLRVIVGKKGASEPDSPTDALWQKSRVTQLRSLLVGLGRQHCWAQPPAGVSSWNKAGASRGRG